jgi:hypothetical protein
MGDRARTGHAGIMHSSRVASAGTARIRPAV